LIDILYTFIILYIYIQVSVYVYYVHSQLPEIDRYRQEQRVIRRIGKGIIIIIVLCRM